MKFGVGKSQIINFIIGLIVSAAFIAVVSLIALFVWNIGVAGLISGTSPIGFGTAYALLTGVFVVHLFANYWVQTIYKLKAAKALLQQLEALLENNNENVR
jgi:hypothetical protein